MSEDQTTQTDETPVEEPTHTDPAPAEDTTPEDVEEPGEDAETFPRAYVEKLRKESATYRERARRADDLAAELFTARVQLTGRLADPTDLPFDAEALDDPARLDAALDDLLSRKPHLASRRPHGSVGQGATASDSGVDLAAILRGRA